MAREILEELGCTITVGAKLVTTQHEYDFAVVNLTTFYCSILDSEPTISEHTAAVWLPPPDLTSLDWAPADLPAVHQIQRDFE